MMESATPVILVIDDEAILRELLSEMLSMEGYGVLLAEDGQPGIELYKQNQDQIATVILDMNLINMHGEETFLGLYEINSKVKVIIATGDAEDEVVIKLVQTYGVDVISKPYEIDTLFKKLTR